MKPNKPAAQLQIDRLVLRGFSRPDAQLVRDAFTTTLQQGLSQATSNGATFAERQQQRHALKPLQASNPHSIGRLAAEALLESLRDE